MTVPASYPPPGPLGQTDPTRWRLSSSLDGGRHVWHYTRDSSSPTATAYEQLWGQDEAGVRDQQEQDDETRYWLGLDLPRVEGVDPKPAENPFEAAKKGYEFYKRLQSADGHWSGEYGGPMFLLPGIIIALYITKTPVPEEWKVEIARYLSNMQRKGGEDDQGWGIHFEAKSSVFGTGLNYVVLRLLGVGPDEPMMVRARNTLHKLGGCEGIPSWGKFWLALLNVHSWRGLNPTPCELWLLPEWAPVHPWKWWIHTRNVYIPMGYLSGVGLQAEEDELIRSLREELYTQPYSTIPWPSLRNRIAPSDVYSPHSPIANAAFAVFDLYDRFAPSFIRRKALDKAYELVVMEDENTGYQTVGPVSKAMNMLCRWHREGPKSEAWKLHLEKVRDFMWMSKDGLMMTGTNGSQLWDAAFIAQALSESRLGSLPQNHASTLSLLRWLDNCQIRENPKHSGKAYRHQTKGAWPFSTKEQGYTVSDCTAEGMKSVLLLQEMPHLPELVSYDRLCSSVDVILSLQNPSGGWASYELIRGNPLLELLNPAEVFANIMIEYPYVECTTACVTSLSLFLRHPRPSPSTSSGEPYRRAEIEKACQSGIEWIKGRQREDGSWYGSWGICFTYATMFSIESLALAGETYANSDHVKRACDFLLSKQMDDGGWGESYKSCETEQYVHNAKSQVVNTAWAVITLLTARYPDPLPIRRGCRLIMQRQLGDGSWGQESIEGVFNKNAAISYPNFKFSWTILALGKAWRELGEEGW